MTKTLYGPHYMSGAYNYRSMMRDMQPAVALMLHPKPEDINYVRQDSPETKIIGRMYLPDNVYSDGIKNDPVGFANDIHQRVLRTDWYAHVDFVQTNNEVQQAYHWVDGQPPGEIERLAQFSCEWMRLAEGHYHCAIGAFSVGQPDIEKGWPLFYDAMRQALHHGHILLAHEYGWPDYWNPAGKWMMGRYATHVWPKLPEELKHLPIVLGEFGYDRLIINKKGGWKSTGLNADKVAEQLQNYHYDFNAWRKQGIPFVGACLFCVGTMGWDDYNYADGGDASPLKLYINRLPEHIEPMPTTVPVEPPPVEPPPIEPPPVEPPVPCDVDVEAVCQWIEDEWLPQLKEKLCQLQD